MSHMTNDDVLTLVLAIVLAAVALLIYIGFLIAHIVLGGPDILV